MAGSIHLFTRTAKAGADLTDAHTRMVAFNPTGELIVANTTSWPVFPCVEPAALGKDVSYLVAGVANVTLGANVVKGQPLKVDALGLAIPAAPGDKSFGYAENSGSTGAYVSAVVYPITV